ncbi:MAG: DUF2752 domain-containing protein [Pyrinomonadaceae bacterium]|nr:DUF2752 domain-containing protein [Pyrinomonadaceae bacterium]
MENAGAINSSAISQSSQRMLAGGGVFSMTVGAGLVWYFDPTRAGFLPACPLYKMTGFACPGCGLTRGFHALFHGDIVTALDFNALIPLFVFIFGFFYVSLLLFAVRGRRIPQWPLSLFSVYGFIVLLLGFGVLRNLPYQPFNVLFP